nr:pentapeptide repeat-containing protein [Amycolatopsis arida]
MLSTTTITVWAVGLLVVAVLAVVLLWSAVGAPGDSVRLDVIRTAASIVVGTGGAAALLLAARRQRATELDLRQRDHDAAERRITELYGKAADQLGSDKAPVRLAGLYALERLAQDAPPHRQTIVNLVCAYLRMPVGADTEEAEVRQAAHDLLARHLRPGSGREFWGGVAVNLAGATLAKVVLTHCSVTELSLAGATVTGPAVFRGTTVSGVADFRNARFLGIADFRRVGFGRDEKFFRGARFEGEVEFGTRTEVTLTGAGVRVADGVRRRWPRGWVERESPDEPGWAVLIAAPAEPRSAMLRHSDG